MAEHNRAGRVRVDGKQFAIGEDRFRFRGVTYGTFRPRTSDSNPLPERDQVKLDFAAINEAGFTTVRTYTAPTDDVCELAADWGLRLLSDAFFLDWRYLIGSSRRQAARLDREARAVVQATARRLAGHEEILALSLGNEIPADVVRWVGSARISRTLDELTTVVKDEDPDLLVTYANYPTAEYLALDGMDFLTFNVYLEQPASLRRYLTRLHHLAGDRPLVLGELGAHAQPGTAGEDEQARALDWQLEVATERGVAGTCVFSWTDDWWVGGQPVEGWHFGLTQADRTPRESLAIARTWNGRTVADLDYDWPSISVVICAYNAEPTMDECLEATCKLDYPNLEIVVVDDGSTDATAEITRRHPRARLISIPHAGLSVARNEGWAAAQGELVVYLDSDAFPTPEWLHYLALGLDGSSVGGVGGPNVAPPSDPPGAHRVAHSPGGPVHVLITDNRAEHVPGCNMAFWRPVLEEVGGFDPIYTSAGDDVDLCWKVLDAGWKIGFHPAALVWHHRRAGLRPYLKQQRGYGRAEALVEARHPDRFTVAGTARWMGKIYSSLPTKSLRQDRIYRGMYGAAAFQSIYRGGGHGLDLAHQIGVPVATLLLLTAPLALLSGPLGLAALSSLAFLAGLASIDLARAKPPRACPEPGWRFRTGVAALHILQPLARTWGRRRHRTKAWQGAPGPTTIMGPARDVADGVLLLPDVEPRPALVSRLIQALRTSGTPVVSSTGWEDHDALLLGSTIVAGELLTSSHPVGSVQVRVRRRPRRRGLVVHGGIAVVVAALDRSAALLPFGIIALELARGLWNTGPRVRRTIRAASSTTVANATPKERARALNQHTGSGPTATPNAPRMHPRATRLAASSDTSRPRNHGPRNDAREPRGPRKVARRP